MKEAYPRESIGRLTGLFGKKRQSYYAHKKRQNRRYVKENEVLDLVSKVREKQPKVGTLKLQYHINEEKGLGWIGRDQLYKILRYNNLLIKRKKRRKPQETNGNGQSIYPDLRKGLVVERINQLWCSDITYIELAEGQKWCYLLCITDEYSHKILSHRLEYSLRWVQLCSALQGAKKRCTHQDRNRFNHQLIFHSDRGSQYKSKAFQKALIESEILSSMTAAGKSYENPVAERLNGILKNELLQQEIFPSFQCAKKAIDNAVKIYNDERLHLSCGMRTPSHTHENHKGQIQKLWKQRKRHSVNIKQ